MLKAVGWPSAERGTRRGPWPLRWCSCPPDSKFLPTLKRMFSGIKVCSEQDGGWQSLLSSRSYCLSSNLPHSSSSLLDAGFNAGFSCYDRAVDSSHRSELHSLLSNHWTERTVSLDIAQPPRCQVQPGVTTLQSPHMGSKMTLSPCPPTYPILSTPKPTGTLCLLTLWFSSERGNPSYFLGNL